MDNVFIGSPVIDYCKTEVWRQGHDVTQSEGLIRVAWMLEAWVYMMGLKGSLTVKHVVNIGRLVEQDKNKDGMRKVAVYVGYRLCPPPVTIKPSLQKLLDKPDKDALVNYRTFEMIHPFIDGNGRTGKILMNYWNDSLRHPFFPPHDFWGHSIRNP